jgi:ribosomal protein S15P/S13E
MRRCCHCKESKPEAEFAWRRKKLRELDTYCRPCRAAYKREHYRANKQRYVDQAGRRRRQLLDERIPWLVSYLREHPCVDCGESDPIVLEFDHLRDKEFGIASGIRSRPWPDVLDEIAKCEVVCANCHRRRTTRRGGFIRAAVAQR